MTGVLLMIVAKEMRFHGDGSYTNQIAVNVVRSFQTISTCCLIYCLFCAYRVEWRFTQLNRQFLKTIKVWTSDRITSFIWELLLCLIHEPPFWDWDVDISLAENERGIGSSPLGPVYVRNPFSLLMFARFYLIIRLILCRCT
jgi:hypothetical protein